MPLCLRHGAQSLRSRRHRRKDQREDVEDQDSVLHRLGLVRLHLQAAPAGQPAMVPGSRRACRRSCCITGPAHLERPFHSFHDEILRWYDHWLKGKDTGILDEPPVKVWVMGENKWRTGEDWPLPETQWSKLYLHSWGRLRAEPYVPGARNARLEPDTFVQMPPTQTNEIQRLRYMTDPLPQDTLVIGPMALNLLRRHRPGRHQLDRHPQRRRPGRIGAHGAAGRSRNPGRSSRARTDPRLAEGLAPRGRSGSGQSRGGRGIRSRAPRRSRSSPARSRNTRSRFYRPAICSRPVTASASTSPASICRAGLPARTTSNTRPITSAAARRWCTRSITTSSTRAIWCCRSFRSSRYSPR